MQAKPAGPTGPGRHWRRQHEKRWPYWPSSRHWIPRWHRNPQQARRRARLELTGEAATWKGVRPLKNFGFGPDGGWGAWQVVLRATELNIDDDAFPIFADPLTSASAATSYGIGLNWYLNPIFRFSTDYNHTDFSGDTLDDENAIITRSQMRY